MVKVKLSKPISYALAFTSAYVVAVVYLSRYFLEHDFINRCGALLSATGAALVVYQALIEARLEKRRALDLNRLTANSLSPLNLEQAELIIRGRAERQVADRIEIVIAIAAIIWVGEIMHGWGDYLHQYIPPRPFGLDQPTDPSETISPKTLHPATPNTGTPSSVRSPRGEGTSGQAS